MTKLLTIGLLLLTYGVVEAVTEGRAIDGKTGQDCLYRYSKAGLEISDCKPYSKGPALVTAEEIWADQKVKHECEKKMREAMKAMDKIMRGDWVHTPYNTYEYQSMVPNAQEREQWENVMKTCVRP